LSSELDAAYTSTQNSELRTQNFLVEPLSEAELKVLRLVATGLSNREIADRLVITVGTTKWHLNQIYSKLHVRNRTEAVALARALELL
jgi:LuxR family maltose regulon positive regulatory protein